MNRNTIAFLTAALLISGSTGPTLAQSTPGGIATEKVQEYQAGGGAYTAAQTEKIQSEYQFGGGSANKQATPKYNAGAAQSLAPSSALGDRFDSGSSDANHTH